MDRIPDRTKAAPAPAVRLGMERPETVVDGRLRAGNASRGGMVATDVVILRSRWARARMAFRRKLAPGEALLIQPCGGVHTLGARYGLRALFLDARGRVLEIVALRPWRATRAPAGTAAALLQRSDQPAAIDAGQRIDWLLGQPRLPDRAAWLQAPEEPE